MKIGLSIYFSGKKVSPVPYKYVVNQALELWLIIRAIHGCKKVNTNTT